MRFGFLPGAEEDIDAIASRYGRSTDKTGKSFLDQLEVALAMIATNPGIGERIEKASRDQIVRGFSVARYPYLVLYKSEADLITIITVAHHSRRPGFWRDRLD